MAKKVPKRKRVRQKSAVMSNCLVFSHIWASTVNILTLTFFLWLFTNLPREANCHIKNVWVGGLFPDFFWCVNILERKNHYFSFMGLSVKSIKSAKRLADFLKQILKCFGNNSVGTDYRQRVCHNEWPPSFIFRPSDHGYWKLLAFICLLLSGWDGQELRTSQFWGRPQWQDGNISAISSNICCQKYVNIWWK